MIKQKSEANIIITINAMKKIMTIFLGPFLTAYFIKKSTESMVDLSIYNIFSYIFLGIGSLIVASIVKRKFQIGMFRVGVITNFLYILTILILREKIVDHLSIISILYGISSATYWFSYNTFVINKIENSERTSYTVKSKMVSEIIGILFPIILGSIITATNFELTAIIIAVISFMQIILSFMIKPSENKNLPEYNLVKVWKQLWSSKQIRKMSLVELFIGMNVSDGALTTLITILILNSFKTNLNLGIITSIASILSIIGIRIYGKVYKNRDDKNIILISSIIPVIILIILLVFRNNFTIILYNFCYVIFTNILTLAREIRLFNISDSYIVRKENQAEFFSGREAILNFGRVIGYSLLLIAGISQNEIVLNIVMLVLTLSILLTGLNVRKIEKFER